MRIIETYDTTDRTDPNAPVEMKGITYIGKDGIQMTIFVLPEDLDAKLAELKAA